MKEMSNSKLSEHVLETRLKWQLVPAKRKELDIELAANKELKKFLTTQAKDLPKEYRYLVSEITTDDEKFTLLELIDVGFEYSDSRGIVNFFSKEGEKIVGFAAYFYFENEVTDVIVFSLYPDKWEEFLQNNFREILANLLNKYKSVTWPAIKENPANAIYQKVNEEFGGKEPEEFFYEDDHEKKKKMLRYHVESKTFQDRNP